MWVLSCHELQKCMTLGWKRATGRSHEPRKSEEFSEIAVYLNESSYEPSDGSFWCRLFHNQDANTHGSSSVWGLAEPSWHCCHWEALDWAWPETRSLKRRGFLPGVATMPLSGRSEAQAGWGWIGGFGGRRKAKEHSGMLGRTCWGWGQRHPHRNASARVFPAGSTWAPWGGKVDCSAWLSRWNETSLLH